MLGTYIGNYRLVTELGGGAMGDVYFAEHAIMGRRAAIKVIREDLSRDRDVIERFINEARAVNAIAHPNIVEITDFGQIGSRYYLIMELLEGETLEARLERQPRLEEQSALRIVAQVCDALSAAHALGIVHRDLKPENIFLVNAPAGKEFVKVLDFGVAKLSQYTGRPDITMPGTLLGTPHYMSPEQCRGDGKLDHRSDIYALGVVLYRMLSGQLPLDNEDLLQLLFAQLSQVPADLRTLVPEVSLKTEAAVMRALQKLPGDRFANMRAFRAALLDQAADTVAVLPVEALAATDHPPAVVRPVQPVAAKALKRGPSRELPAPALQPVVASLVKPADPAKANTDVAQPKRVANRLARIVLERLHAGRLQLPILSTAALRCVEQLRETNIGSSALASTLARDPLLASQVFRRANSVLLGGGARVRTLEAAVGRLGAVELRALLMELSARKLFESRNPAIRHVFQGLWEHGLAVAEVAQQLALRCAGANPESAYLAGLLHDIGKPVTAAVLLEAERQAVSTAEEWLDADNWLEIVADCHREVGVATARSWLLPEEIIQAIARSNRYTPEGRTATANLVCFANALVKDEGVYAGEIDKEEVQLLIAQGQELYGVSDEQLLQIRTRIRRRPARP